MELYMYITYQRKSDVCYLLNYRFPNIRKLEFLYQNLRCSLLNTVVCSHFQNFPRTIKNLDYYNVIQSKQRKIIRIKFIDGPFHKKTAMVRRKQVSNSDGSTCDFQRWPNYLLPFSSSVVPKNYRLISSVSKFPIYLLSDLAVLSLGLDHIYLIFLACCQITTEAIIIV